jgi:hypothetical protein
MWRFSNQEDSSQPIWNDAGDESKIGALCVIGITELRGGQVANQYQMYGRIREITREGVIFDLGGSHLGQTWQGPADERAFFAAQPGEYKLKSTGEIVTNPDYTVTWSIELNSKSAN